MYNCAYGSNKLSLLIVVLSLSVFILNPITSNAQERRGNSYKLTLAEAVQLAKS